MGKYSRKENTEFTARFLYYDRLISSSHRIILFTIAIFTISEVHTSPETIPVDLKNVTEDFFVDDVLIRECDREVGPSSTVMFL